MNKRMKALICLVLSLCFLLSGCGVVNLQGWFQELGEILSQQATPFSQMEYARPDIRDLTDAQEDVASSLQQQEAVEDLMEKVYAFYNRYYEFYTQYALANIYYYQDITDIYWEEEYSFCMEMAAQADNLLDTVLYDLAQSPLRMELEQEAYFGSGFFDEYDGESLWTEEFTSLMEQEAKLQGRYYEILAQNATLQAGSEEYYEICGGELAQLLVEMVKLRKDIAKAAGYENYLEFAYDYYYNRDYTYTQVQELTGEIQNELVPIYRELAGSDLWNAYGEPSSQYETFQYVKDCAKAMGGRVEAAFDHMSDGKLYDISFGQNKYDASFEIYLYTYDAPFVFVNPTGSIYDKLTFTHEFGHYCHDHASYGSVAGVDVSEVFSQGLEYLSLSYGNAPDSLEKLKLADGLCVYVEQAAYADFEHLIYLEEDLTAQRVQQLYAQIGEDYGFDWEGWESRSFVEITHFYIAPLYVISYVVSNDAAFQLYQTEQKKPGNGLQILQEQLDTEETQFLAFLKSAKLKSPFEAGRIQMVATTFREMFQNENGAAIYAAPFFIQTAAYPNPAV